MICWVGVIGDGTEGNEFRPDVPRGVDFVAEIPVEIRPNHLGHGRPLVACCRIRVSDADVNKFTATEPTEKDRAIVEAFSEKTTRPAGDVESRLNAALDIPT